MGGGALVRGFSIVIGRRSRVLKSDRKVDGAARGREGEATLVNISFIL